MKFLNFGSQITFLASHTLKHFCFMTFNDQACAGAESWGRGEIVQKKKTDKRLRHTSTYCELAQGRCCQKQECFQEPGAGKRCRRWTNCWTVRQLVWPGRLPSQGCLEGLAGAPAKEQCFGAFMLWLGAPSKTRKGGGWTTLVFRILIHFRAKQNLAAWWYPKN